MSQCRRNILSSLLHVLARCIESIAQPIEQPIVRQLKDVGFRFHSIRHLCRKLVCKYYYYHFLFLCLHFVKHIFLNTPNWYLVSSNKIIAEGYLFLPVLFNVFTFPLQVIFFLYSDSYHYCCPSV